MKNQYSVFWREKSRVFLRTPEVDFFRWKDSRDCSDKEDFCAEKTCAYFQVQSKP